MFVIIHEISLKSFKYMFKVIKLAWNRSEFGEHSLNEGEIDKNVVKIS